MAMTKTEGELDDRGGAVAGIIFDLDGTLLRGHQPMPGAISLLHALERPYVIASNNSSDTAAGLAASLRRVGLCVCPDRLILAGEIALEEVACRFDGADVMLIAAAPLHDRARAIGIRTVTQGGDVVLVCRDERFDYAALAAAANSLQRGAHLMAANPDRSHPGHAGAAIPETGSLLAAVMAASGRTEAEIIGKPQPLMLRRALARLGVEAGEALLVGDNQDTDGAGAQRLGIAFHQVDGSRRAPLGALDVLKSLPSGHARAAE
ncbi:MAG: HAD-IIA family hydrolase [Roseovarius sp.]